MSKTIIQNNIENKNKVTLETNKILLKIYVKKDYSLTDNLKERKQEFIHNINEIVEWYGESDELEKTMEQYE